MRMAATIHVSPLGLIVFRNSPSRENTRLAPPHLRRDQDKAGSLDHHDMTRRDHCRDDIQSRDCPLLGDSRWSRSSPSNWPPPHLQERPLLTRNTSAGSPRILFPINRPSEIVKRSFRHSCSSGGRTVSCTEVGCSC